MNKYKIGDKVHLLYDTETVYLVKNVKSKNIPIQDGADKNQIIKVVQIIYYDLEDGNGNKMTVDEDNLR